MVVRYKRLEVIKMADETNEKWDIYTNKWRGNGYCPYGTGLGSKLYDPPACNAKIIKKEPLLTSEKASGQLVYMDNTTNWNIDSTMVRWYLYQCEKGHISLRHDGWADVPEVPPGTIPQKGFSGIDGMVNKPPLWYTRISDEEKKKVLK